MVNVYVPPLQATKAVRVGRDIALPFLDFATEDGGGV